MLSLRTMLGDAEVQRFLDEHFQRLPRSGHFDLKDLEEFDIWQCLVRAFQSPRADVMICRRNQRFEGSFPGTDAELQALSRQGYTFLLRHAERWDDRLSAIAQNFERDLGTTANIHLYSTPALEFGFGWHYDAEEVFILQTQGEKTYELRKNTVHPWPVEESIPEDMHYEREIMPLWKCALAAGHWLYIPSGYWHRATAGAHSMSIALGLKPLTGIDVWDYLRTKLASNLVFRQRLPPTGAVRTDRAALSAEVRQFLENLTVETKKLFADKSLPESMIGRRWAKLDEGDL